MKQRNVFLFIISVVVNLSTTAYELPSQGSYCFKGTHYFAQYYGCDVTAMTNTFHMLGYFTKAIDKSGATLLRIAPHTFENNAMTIVAVLSESHASIHTYPEHGAVFVDLFTCGDKCDYREFEKVMKAYLSPTKIRSKVRVRK
jgi:S-adenosylmethionine decarboxylase